MNSWAALKADTHRQYGSFQIKFLIKGFIKNRTFRVIATMRLCQIISTAPRMLRMTLPVFQVLHRISSHGAAMDLSWRTQIGGGLALTHGWGLVINPQAKIGSNVTLFHGVTLGCREKISPEGQRFGEYPVIEDEVWIGPHAIIVGGVTVGRGSRIAGGAFVVDSIPPHSIVSGNPSTIVKSNCVPDIVNPAPLFD